MVKDEFGDFDPLVIEAFGKYAYENGLKDEDVFNS